MKKFTITTSTSCVSVSMNNISYKDKDRSKDTPALLTKQQLAKHYHCSMRTIDNWMMEGITPYYKIGRIVRFRLDEVEMALEKYRQNTVKEGTPIGR